MFWSGNYIAVRELNFLLKEENVSLTQVLEADDILQECKADNKALIQFLTKPEVLAELITLITEEPPKDVELASQYRHASIACEVLTSHLSTLADRLSLDTVQMNRLCDFINKEPPLNPLLASYFSKTVEMLLERSPKQDWYLYHIVCLRVLDFFRSRRDFLPNLLRHMATSAIADTFKYLLRLDDLFNKIVMEWLDEHQFLESLIQIVCGSYVPEPVEAHAPGQPSTELVAATLGREAHSGAPETNHTGEGGNEDQPVENKSPAVVSQTPASSSADELTGDRDKWRAVAASNAAALLTDLILTGCAGEGCTTRLRTVWVLVSRLQSEQWVRALLAGMFTSPARARHQALVHGCQLLLALLSTDPILGGQCAAERSSVELAVAPHLPLLHHALLHTDHDGGGGGGGGVGAARVHVAALLAQLALSEVEEVPTTIITLGTPGTLVELFFRYPDNNFLHAQVYAFLKHALANRAYCTHYANHLLIECDLLSRLMDAYEENEQKRAGVPRAGYMGHVILALRRCAQALTAQDGALLAALALSGAVRERWAAFTAPTAPFALTSHRHDTPLGGYYPSEKIYEVETMTDLADSIEANYGFNDMGGNALDELNEEFGEPTDGGDGQQRADGDISSAAKTFLELANQRFDDDMWDDSPDEEFDEGGSKGAAPQDVQDVLAAVAPWESVPAGDGAAADDDWAQFGAAPASPPVDPFAPAAPAPPQFAPLWPSSHGTGDLPDDIMRLSHFSISDTFPEQINDNNHTAAAAHEANIDFNVSNDNDRTSDAAREANKEINYDSDSANVEAKDINFDNDAADVETKEINVDNVNVDTNFSNTANQADNAANIVTKDINLDNATKSQTENTNTTDNRATNTEIKANVDHSQDSKLSCTETKETTDNSASNDPNSDVLKANLDLDNDNTIKVTDSAENVTTNCETSDVPESMDRSDS